MKFIGENSTSEGHDSEKERGDNVEKRGRRRTDNGVSQWEGNRETGVYGGEEKEKSILKSFAKKKALAIYTPFFLSSLHTPLPLNYLLYPFF